MYYLVVFFLIFHCSLLCLDEFYFHYRRGLPKWEIIGHPLDTLTILFGILFLKYRSYSEDNLKIYIIISFFSCIFVTKDELLHHKLCTTGEMWVHGLLLICHPIIFICAAYIKWFPHSPQDKYFYQLMSLNRSFNQLPNTMMLILVYEIIFWSVVWKRIFPLKNNKLVV
jgi:hypothetical protein